MYQEINPVFAMRGKHRDSDGTVVVKDVDGNVALLTIIDQRHTTMVVMTPRQAAQLSASLDAAVGAALDTNVKHVHGSV